MAVYFIRAGEAGPVKIGTAGHVPWRLNQLQMGHYEELRVIREIAGGRLEEAWCHRHFAALRVRGEWFRFAPEMLSVVVPVIARGTSAPFPLIAALEALGAARNISVDRLCELASINRATWQRIKGHHVKPSYDTLTSLQALLKDLSNEPQQRAA